MSFVLKEWHQAYKACLSCRRNYKAINQQVYMPFRMPSWNLLCNCHPNSKLYSTIFPKRCRLEKYKVLDNTTRGGLQFQCPYCIEDSSSTLMVNRYSKDFLSILRAKAPTSIRSWRYCSFLSIYTKLVQNSENCSTKILPINYYRTNHCFPSGIHCMVACVADIV